MGRQLDRGDPGILVPLYDRQRGLAISLTLNGASAAGFTVAPVLTLLSSWHGLGKAVPEAACPLLLVVRKPGTDVTAAEITAHLAGHVAKWWLPDEIVFVEELPHTATGKLLKTALRERYKDHRLAA